MAIKIAWFWILNSFTSTVITISRLSLFYKTIRWSRPLFIGHWEGLIKLVLLVKICRGGALDLDVHALSLRSKKDLLCMPLRTRGKYWQSARHSSLHQKVLPLIQANHLEDCYWFRMDMAITPSASTSFIKKMSTLFQNKCCKRDIRCVWPLH